VKKKRQNWTAHWDGSDASAGHCRQERRCFSLMKKIEKTTFRAQIRAMHRVYSRGANIFVDAFVEDRVMMCARCCGLGMVESGIGGLGRTSCPSCLGSGKDRLSSVFDSPAITASGTVRARRTRAARTPLTNAQKEDNIATLIGVFAGGFVFYQGSVVGGVHWVASALVALILFLLTGRSLTKHGRWFLATIRWSISTALTLIVWGALIAFGAYLLQALQ
jgi:hypothetical protein